MAHPYPVTPYHADYFHHADRLPPGGAQAPAAPRIVLTYRAGSGDSPSLTHERVPTNPDAYDISLGERPIEKLLHDDVVIQPSLWLDPPWVKEGWFQAFHLLRASLDYSNETAAKRADALYGRLTGGPAGGLASGSLERVNAERDLLALLTRDCTYAVVGYRLRREFHSDEFSNGVENIAVDSQTGFNSAVAMRTLKLKDLPWNGWLRLGIDTPPTAAWNPIGGFSDPAGRLLWSVVGDAAYLPVPYNSLWVQNRAEVRPDDAPPARQSIRIPDGALVADLDKATLRPAAAGDTAMAKLTYRVSASAFHDGAEMETADLVYPYAMALRWALAKPDAKIREPRFEFAAQQVLQRFRAVRLVSVEETKLPIADLVFEYRWPIIEVYLNDPLPDDDGNAVIAPPWTSVPWHLLALMEAAVERGIAAFSQPMAQRYQVPWLDLVRDTEQRTKLRALIKEFMRTGHRPAAIEGLVTADAAKARWQALDAFAEANGHLLVTNGPYKLKSATSEVVTLDVIREFTYPIGLGTFDFYAYPAKAVVTRVERIGNKVFVTADAEILRKQQRDHKLTVVPLQRDTLRGTLPIRAVARYTLVAQDGKVVATGLASREPDGRFAATLPALPTGQYRFFAGIFLDGNTTNPALGRVDFRVN